MSDDRGLVNLLRSRIGVEFDGESHLTSAEAQSVAAAIERLLAERDSGTTLYTVISDIREASGLGAKPMLSELAAKIGKIRAERGEARLLVTEANNSLYGSHGYFHSLNGDPFDRYHLANGIEALKQTSNLRWHDLQDAEAQRDKLKGMVEQAFRDGLTYATNCIVTDPDEAWRTSRARQALQDSK